MATAKQEPKSNEPGQVALDIFNLTRIRAAEKAAGEANEVNNSAKNKLRGVFAITAAQNLNNDAAKLALKLVEGGDEAIDEFCEKVRKAGVYVGYLGKVLSPRQFELFGMAGTGPTPEDERAKIEGRAAGFAQDGEEGSTEQSNPYPGSIKGQSWLAAFRQARGERDAIMSMPEPQAAAGDGEKEPDGNGEEGKA